jgi:undecaprenyl-diphosphatase
MKALAHKLYDWDAVLCFRISRWNGKRFFDACFYWISKSADVYLYVGLAIVVVAADQIVGTAFVRAACPAFALEQVVYHVLKARVRRPRPCDAILDVRFLIRPPDRFSFPSGHTAAAFVMVTLLASFYPPIVVPAVLWASLVGFSRVYLGVHYPGDVLFGAAIGMVSAKVGLMLLT